MIRRKVHFEPFLQEKLIQIGEGERVRRFQSDHGNIRTMST
jgi:hypothetical protein